MEHNYRFVDDMFSLTGVVPGEEAYKLKRTVRRAADGGHLVFLGADLWWREDEKGRIKFETGVHWREKDYPIKIRRYPVRDSMDLGHPKVGSIDRVIHQSIEVVLSVAIIQGGDPNHHQNGHTGRLWDTRAKETMGQVLASVVGWTRHHHGGDARLVWTDATVGKEGYLKSREEKEEVLVRVEVSGKELPV